MGCAEAGKIMDSREEFVQLVMDCSSGIITSRAPLTRKAVHGIEPLTQRLIYAIHIARKSMLALIAPSLHRRKPKKVTNNAITCIPSIAAIPADLTTIDIQQSTVGAPNGGNSLDR